MSGGSLDYFYSEMESKIGCFHDAELDDLVRDMAKLFHDYEWYTSGDTNEGYWRESRDAFKKKWFRDGARAERIETYLDDLKKELLDSLGLSDEYCKNCARWMPEKEGLYGDCDAKRGCLWHRSERCEQFDARGGAEHDGQGTV